MMMSDYKLFYFTTPFCGVCQSVKPIIDILAQSLEIELKEINMNYFENTIAGLVVRQTPALALIHKENVLVYYTDKINNLSDLYQRFTAHIS